MRIGGQVVGGWLDLALNLAQNVVKEIAKGKDDKKDDKSKASAVSKAVDATKVQETNRQTTNALMWLLVGYVLYSRGK